MSDNGFYNHFKQISGYELDTAHVRFFNKLCHMVDRDLIYKSMTKCFGEHEEGQPLTFDIVDSMVFAIRKDALYRQTLRDKPYFQDMCYVAAIIKNRFKPEPQELSAARKRLDKAMGLRYSREEMVSLAKEERRFSAWNARMDDLIEERS